jgi:hypothetical protein
MYPAQQGGTTKEDFLFVAEEGYFREDVCWTEVEYGIVMQHVKKWMA